MMYTINVNNEKTCAVEEKATIDDLLKKEYPKLAGKVVAAEYNGDAVDLDTVIDCDGDVVFIHSDSPKGLEVIRHSASHIMAEAVCRIYKDVKYAIGPAIENGFYYDFDVEERISSEDLEKIEEVMQEIIKENKPFKRVEMSKADAIHIFNDLGQTYKVELLKDIPDETVSVYKQGDFRDLCRGPHVPDTSYIKAFKLTSVAGSYWRGISTNKMLQRIYGTAFADKKALRKYLNYIEEAKKRDHRKLGKELDLFSFQEEGPGFAFMHPYGWTIFNTIVDYCRKQYFNHGYQEIRTPVILNEQLWHRSGHWDNYKENMYFTQIDDNDYAVKPMNCPGGLLVYKNTLHSYKEFPLRMAELGLVHRHEKSGVLHGLLRVRQFTQDDAHIFCTEDQLEDEIINVVKLIFKTYKDFGFDEYHVELSTKPEKHIGEDEVWQQATEALKAALGKLEINYVINEGEGAFYGPKIDFHIKDCLDRSWQCGTIQIDFSMPMRFGLEYIGTDGEAHTPIMIHRAVLGSLERFMAVLLEHYGGALPVWLAPVQVMVIPVADSHHEYASKVWQTMRNEYIRAEIDLRNEKIGYKIREATVRKIPYMVIIGDEEVANDTISIRARTEGEKGITTVEVFVKELVSKIAKRTR